MSIVPIPRPSARHWAYPAALMKECLEEFLATPDARRPKKLTPQLAGLFKDLFVPAIFYASDQKPNARYVPKQVRAMEPSWGIGVLDIAMKAMKDAGVVAETTEEYAVRLKEYHKFLQRLPTLPFLKERDRAAAEQFQRFVVALSNQASKASSGPSYDQVYDD